MSDEFTTYEAPPEEKRNGAEPRQPQTRDPLPGISIRELIEERNWTALGGLGLIALGALYVVGDLFNLSFNLWAILLLGIGGWLMANAWETYQSAGQTWVGKSRNRMNGGAVIALVGLLGLLDISWWAVLLLVTSGWLGYGAWRRVEASGGRWTQSTRNRMYIAGAVGLVGLFGLLNMGSAWPLLLIIIGGVMLYRHLGGKTR